MKKFETGTSFHIESEDGSCHTVSIASVKVSKTGEVQVVGQFTDPASVRYVNEPIDIKPGRIRSTMYCSALVRFLYKGRMRTGAITHSTMKAFRIINMDLGAAWIPLHVLRWSEQAEQFVVIDPEYEMDFTTDVKPGMDIYPYNMEPENLIMLNELTNSSKS